MFFRNFLPFMTLKSIKNFVDKYPYALNILEIIGLIIRSPPGKLQVQAWIAINIHTISLMALENK